MKTLIILNGECKDITFLKNLSEGFDNIICADGGYLHAVAAGIIPHLVVGDFDSSQQPNKIDCVVYPKDKDLSDAEIAIEYAQNNYGGDITLTCTLGKRLDHQLFNVFLLTKYPGLCIEEVDVNAFMCKVYNDFSKFEGKTISFFPIEKANITLHNFKYNIYDHDVLQGDTFTLSNVALCDATIKVNSGNVIAIINKTDN